MFIVQQLPPGASGLVIAGIFAASMSSLDSSMNSVATAYVTDFHRRLNPGVTDRHCLNLARVITVILGGIGITAAMLMAGLEIKFIFDLFNNVIGLFGGALAGVFVLGIFFRRANWIGALAGFVAGAVVPGLLLLESTIIGRWNVNGWLFGAFGTISCIVIGWLVSRTVTGKQSGAS
jgi:Na+/proline symporter